MSLERNSWIGLDSDEEYSSDWAEYAAKVERRIIQQLASLKIGGQPIMRKAITGSSGNPSNQPSCETTVNYENVIQIQKKSPKLSVSAVKSFFSLDVAPQLLQGLFEMGLGKPSRLQEVVLPTLLANPAPNMMVQAQPGTGKMVAFVLGALARVDPAGEYPQVLCLVPSYEFTMQTGDVVTHIAKYCPRIKIGYASDGTTRTEQIVIGTPNAALDWACNLRTSDLKKIKILVVYEAGEMIVQQDLREQYVKIHKNLHSSCQMMFLSATFGKAVEDFIEHFVKNLITVQMKENLDDLRQYYVRCAGREGKFNALTSFYDKIETGRVIIFCRSRRTAVELAEKITADGLGVAVLLGDCTVEQIRKGILEKFNGQAEQMILIMTSVLIRGIDFGRVALVVNFDVPTSAVGLPDCNTYLHRISRIGRFGRKGTVINLVESEEALILCKILEQRFQCTIHELKSNEIGRNERV